MPPRIREAEARATELYSGARTLFPGLALTAVIKLTAVTVPAVLLFGWNNRRMCRRRRPRPPPAGCAAAWARRPRRHPPSRNQASFFFTMQTLLRSAHAPPDDRRVARVRPDGKRVRGGGGQRDARAGTACR